jgi:hypothetical protein
LAEIAKIQTLLDATKQSGNLSGQALSSEVAKLWKAPAEQQKKVLDEYFGLRLKL